MQFDGFAVEKWRAQFTGAIEIEEREGLAMRTDKVVVMVVATRIRKSVPEPLDEDGTMRITRQNKIEHLAVLEGDLREQALSLLATGSERGFQGTLLAELEPGVDPTTGEITSGMASYAAPLAEEKVTLEAGMTDEELAALDQEYHDDPEPDDVIYTPPEPAHIVSADEIPEYFDVPPIKDDSQPVGTGPIKKPGTGSGNNGGGDGPKVAPVNYSDLAAVGSSPEPSGAPAPVGEVVGRVRGPRKDKVLEDFFNEENP